MNGVDDERRHREDGLLDDEEEKRSVVLVQHRVVELDAGRVEDRTVVEAAIRNALSVTSTHSFSATAASSYSVSVVVLPVTAFTTSMGGLGASTGVVMFSFRTSSTGSSSWQSSSVLFGSSTRSSCVRTKCASSVRFSSFSMYISHSACTVVVASTSNGFDSMFFSVNETTTWRWWGC